MITRIITLLVACSLVACSSSPTQSEGFKMRHTGIAAGSEFWEKYWLKHNRNDLYRNLNGQAPLAAPSSNIFKNQASFGDMTTTRRPAVAPLYPRQSSSELAKSWILNWDKTPYGR
tara:strand:+ start:122 stop:469 length:348 start_codon:yes stop_codon:yes gene_type:complete